MSKKILEISKNFRKKEIWKFLKIESDERVSYGKN